MTEIGAARALMQGLSATPTELLRQGFNINQDGVRRSALDLLVYPEIDLPKLAAFWPELAELKPAIAEQMEIDGRYAGYLKRQEADIHAFRRDEALLLPVDLDYDAVPSLSNEVREKLKLARPATLGAAGRISGVTPAALTILLRHVRRRDKQADKLSA
jgi:tRNA uridine 5-carboxymethylaminomethyl modification enzyme